MIIDAHVHLLPKRVRQDRTPFCQSDAGFARLYESEKARLVSEEEIVEYLDRTGIDKAVVFGFPWAAPEVVKQNNDEVWNFHVRYPDRVIPFAVLSSPCGEPFEREALRTLEGGFVGLGELGAYERGWDAQSLDALHATLRLASEFHAPVLLHVNEPVGHVYPGKIPIDSVQLLSTIQSHPEVDFILAHWGGGLFFYGLMPEIRDALRRTFVDTAASPFLYSHRIFPVAQEIIGTDKIIFGSDFPLLSLPRYVKQMDEAMISESDKRQILGENLLRILPQP